MPSEEQKNWVAAVFGIKLSAQDSAPGNAHAVAAADNTVSAPGSGGDSYSDWEKKFYADQAESDAKYEKLKEQALRAIDDANRAFEKEQREPHPSRPMEFHPRSGMLKTPEEISEIELIESKNHVVLQLHIGSIPDGHQLSVSIFNSLNRGHEEANWTFKVAGAQTVKAILPPGIYELAFDSEKLPERIGPGRPIQCFYSLTLEPQAVKAKAAPPRRR